MITPQKIAENLTLELGMQVGLRLFNCQNRARNLPRLLPPLQVLQQERQKQDVGRTAAFPGGQLTRSGPGQSPLSCLEPPSSDRESDGTQKLRQIELALEQARYEAARSHRQFDAVDPDNRLVAADLERRWNERLTEVARLEAQVHVIHEERPAAITETERADILALGADVARLWNHPSASIAIRKRILRVVLEEIIVAVDSGVLHLKLHWKGGDHTTLIHLDRAEFGRLMADARHARCSVEIVRPPT